jgi:hypothetical protein
VRVTVTKAAKKKSASGKKKSVKKSVKRSGAKGPVNVPEIREKIRRLIAAKVGPMVNANAVEATKGSLPPLKYLFEVLGVYPESAQTEAEPEESNDLAEVLLKRLDFPYREPAEEEQDEIAAVPAGAGNDSVE